MEFDTTVFIGFQELIFNVMFKSLNEKVHNIGIKATEKYRGMFETQKERLVSTLEHTQVPKWDRTRCPEEK